MHRHALGACGAGNDVRADRVQGGRRSRRPAADFGDRDGAAVPALLIVRMLTLATYGSVFNFVTVPSSFAASALLPSSATAGSGPLNPDRSPRPVGRTPGGSTRPGCCRVAGARGASRRGATPSPTASARLTVRPRWVSLHDPAPAVPGTSRAAVGTLQERDVRGFTLLRSTPTSASQESQRSQHDHSDNHRAPIATPSTNLKPIDQVPTSRSRR